MQVTPNNHKNSNQCTATPVVFRTKAGRLKSSKHWELERNTTKQTQDVLSNFWSSGWMKHINQDNILQFIGLLCQSWKLLDSSISVSHYHQSKSDFDFNNTFCSHFISRKWANILDETFYILKRNGGVEFPSVTFWGLSTFVTPKTQSWTWFFLAKLLILLALQRTKSS